MSKYSLHNTKAAKIYCKNCMSKYSLHNTKDAKILTKKRDLSTAYTDALTNLRNRGLISEDRSTKATLLFTIPRSCLSRLHRIYLRRF